MNAYYRVNQPDVTFESFDSELLAINLRNGNYYSLRATAVPIWLLAAGGAGRDEIQRALAGSCGTDVNALAGAVDHFLDELVAEALLVRLDAPPPPAPNLSPPALPATFTPPVLERYTDMQQLLLMDPIHEVDATGWPAKAPDRPQP